MTRDFAWQRKCAVLSGHCSDKRQSTTFIWEDFNKWNHPFCFLSTTADIDIATNCMSHLSVHSPEWWCIGWNICWGLCYYCCCLASAFWVLMVLHCSLFFGQDVAPAFSVCQWRTPMARVQKLAWACVPFQMQSTIEKDVSLPLSWLIDSALPGLTIVNYCNILTWWPGQKIDPSTKKETGRDKDGDRERQEESERAAQRQEERERGRIGKSVTELKGCPWFGWNDIVSL